MHCWQAASGTLACARYLTAGAGVAPANRVLHAPLSAGIFIFAALLPPAWLTCVDIALPATHAAALAIGRMRSLWLSCCPAAHACWPSSAQAH